MSSNALTRHRRYLSLQALLAVAAANLGCGERVQIVDGCTLLHDTSPIVAEVLVDPNFLKTWEFSPSIAWSDSDHIRYTHCKGSLRLSQAFATQSEAYRFEAGYVVFADSLEIGRDILRPNACEKVSQLGFDPARRSVVRELREIKWTFDSPPRGSLSAEFPDYYHRATPLTCATEPFPTSDYVQTDREARLHIRMPPVRVRFDLQGNSLEPLQIGFHATAPDVVYTIRRTYPRATDPAAISEAIAIETPTAAYTVEVNFTGCAGLVVETNYVLDSGQLQKYGQQCHN